MDIQAGKPTIKPFPNFNCENDCKALKEAMKGLGTNEQAIIDIISKRSSSQRVQLIDTYKTMFGKDLIKELKSELSGNFENVILQLMNDPISADAKSLRDAMKGAGTDEATLTEIICTRSGPKILKIREQYKKMYNRDLEKDVVSETSGYYRRLLVACLQGNRARLTDKQIEELHKNGAKAIIDQDLARKEAEELYAGGEVKFGTDESEFIRIFSTRNAFQLAATFKIYEKISGKDIVTAIQKETSGDLASALKAIVMSQVDRIWYFAYRLYRSMVGLGTNDTTLIRIIVTRSEIDLKDIKEQFYKDYGRTLEEYVAGDTSGDYRKILLSIIEGNY